MRTDWSVSSIGVDCHRAFSKVTARNAGGRIVWRQRLEHADRGELRKQLGSWPKGVPVIVEATFGWGWLCDELQGAGLNPHLASSRKVAAWRDARGMAKSDRTDADLLSELWGQSTDGERWWEVWLPPPLVRDRREWLRYRMSLVGMQTRLKNQIHAILHRHGIVQEFADLFGTQGRRMLRRLAAGKDERLQGGGRAMLAGYLELLRNLREQIAWVTREVYRQVTRTPETRRLTSLPGVGMILAHTILAEVGDMRRFRSAKHLASYSLLAPRAYDSGKEKDADDAPKGRHVGHIGRRTLKWAWIEAAHGAVRSGGRLREIFDRYTDGGKRNRNRGYIRVGHELCCIAYSMSNKERDYTVARPARPGSEVKRTPGQREAHRERRKADGILRRAARAATGRRVGVAGSACLSAGYGQKHAEMTYGNSRPGTGGPEDPMVAVG